MWDIQLNKMNWNEWKLKKKICFVDSFVDLIALSHNIFDQANNRYSFIVWKSLQEKKKKKLIGAT